MVINIGNKLQHSSPTPLVPRGPKFIDMRIDFNSIGNVMLTEVPLVADVGYGLDDLIAGSRAVDDGLAQAEGERPRREVRKFSEGQRTPCALIVNGPDWDEARSSPTA